MSWTAASAGVAAAPGAPASGARAPRRRGRGAVLGLCAIVLFLGIADGFPLIALPFGVLLVGLGRRQRWWWIGLAALVWALALTPSGGTVQTLSRGWALMLGGGFLVATVLRPRWTMFSRALLAVGSASAVAAAVLASQGGWPQFDATMADHFRGLASSTGREFVARFPDAAWAENMAAMAARFADAQAAVFPALLGLQSLAALALAWWAFRGIRSRSTRPALRPLREFRFNDGLIWVMVAGVVLLLLPLGDAAVRTAYNLLLFMSVLYVLRGLAVFVFLARGAPTALSVALGLVATVLFYPIVFTAALLVGVGDTWLDVRGRVVAAASRA